MDLRQVGNYFTILFLSHYFNSAKLSKSKNDENETQLQKLSKVLGAIGDNDIILEGCWQNYLCLNLPDSDFNKV